MPTRIVLTDDYVFIRGIYFKRSYEWMDEADTFEEKTIVFNLRLKDSFEPIFSLSTDDEPTANGSFLTITNAAERKFDLLIDGADIAAFDFENGNWWIEYEDERLGRGTFTVEFP